MTTRLQQAILLATTAHLGQFDKGGRPYILHPLAVADMVDTEDEKIVAVLHDVLEDTEVPPLVINHLFGKEILDAVVSVSRLYLSLYGSASQFRIPKEHADLYEKEAYSDYIQRCAANPIGRRVKIADLNHNSLPERVAQLPPEEQGVTKRYAKAIATLTS